jgi:hypothetical protein
LRGDQQEEEKKPIEWMFFLTLKISKTPWSPNWPESNESQFPLWHVSHSADFASHNFFFGKMDWKVSSRGKG